MTWLKSIVSIDTLKGSAKRLGTWVWDQLSLAFEDCAKNPRVWVVVAIAFAAGYLIGGL